MDHDLPSKPKHPVSQGIAYPRSSLSATTAMMAQKPQAFNLRDLLVVFFKHKYKIILLFLAAVIAAPMVYSRLPVTYEASSILMIRYGREYSRPSIGADSAPLRASLPEIISTEMSILSSRDLKEEVIRSVGMERIFPALSDIQQQNFDPMDIAVLMFSGSLTTTPQKNSNIIYVSFTHKNPQVSADVVNTLIDVYKEKRMEFLKDSKSLPFLDKKVAEYRRKLDESEARLAALKQEHKVFSFDQQRSLTLTQRMNLDATSKSTQTQVKELKQKLASLENQMKTITQTVSLPQEENRGVSEAELQLLTLERKERELLTKYTENNVFITSVRNEIRLVKEFIENQKKKSPQAKPGGNEFYQSIQKDVISTKAELSSLEVRSTELKQQLDEIDREILALDLQEKNVKDLERQVAINEQNYQSYLRKLEDVRISDEMDRQEMTSVSVVQKASVPLFRKTPTKPLTVFVAIAALLGLGGGLALAFGLEFLTQSLISPQKAEKCLGLPVLTSISYKKLEA